MVRTIAIVVVFVVSATTVMQAQCSDALILDNVAKVIDFDIDTTGHWWAITQPYDQFRQLIVDGKEYGSFDSLTKPIFSYDGSTWAARGVRSNVAVVIRPNGVTHNPLPIEAIGFPSQSYELWWVEVEGANRRITNGERTYVTGYQAHGLRFDPQGFAVAWLERRAGQDFLMMNGKEIARGENIVLAGVWATGDCLYSLRTGGVVAVMLGSRELVTNARSVSSLQLNPFGTIAAWQATDATSQMRTYVYSDDFTAPWESPVIAQADPELTLSPFDALVAYRTTYMGSQVVGFNAAMYPRGVVAGPPVFSHNGAFMAYTSRDNGDFVVLNGKRYLIKAGVPLTERLAVSTDGETVAWCSSTTLVVVHVEANTVVMGRMCDQMGRAVFDRRDNSFKAIGVVGGRLYLLTCTAR